MLAAGAARDELQVERVTLRIQASPEPPHAAAADFDLVRLVGRRRSGPRPLDALTPIHVLGDGRARADDCESDGTPHHLLARRSRAGDRVMSPAPSRDEPRRDPDRAGPRRPARGPWMVRPRGRMARARRLAYRGLYARTVRRLFSRALACRCAPFCPRAHREAARYRGRAGHLSRRRARRSPHRQASLSGAWHPRRAAPSREGCDDARTHAPLALARLPHRAAGPRLAPDRGRQSAAVRGAWHRAGHLPVPAVRPGGEAEDPAILRVQAADRGRRDGGDVCVRRCRADHR